MVEPRVAPPAPGPRADAGTIQFGLDDPVHNLRGVRLEQDLGLALHETEFAYDGGAGRWTLTLPRPPVWRIEYRLQLLHRDGGVETINDPAADAYAPGAFGEKSVLQLPDYTPPAWLGSGRRWERSIELRVPGRTGPIDVTVLSPEASTQRLLVAHDGPEYDRLACLGEFAAAVVEAGMVSPFHLALADPGQRNQRYSANPWYGTALADQVIPALHRGLGTDEPVVLMGASLGGLAALHAQRRHPDGIGGLFLQSGSFFVPEYDECESNFTYFRRIVRYVTAVHHTRSARSAVPVTLTCGATEENVHNNRRMAASLARQGYRVAMHELPDMHNFTAWRDAFDPYLVELLTTVWGRPDA